MALTIYHQFAIALGLGLLVGMQREWSKSSIAGIRTFAFITLLGALCALLSERFGGWVVAAGLIGVAAMIVVGNVGKYKRGEVDPGITSEIAALVMFGVGALVIINLTGLAVAVAGSVAVLLHWKSGLHGLVQRFGEADIRAIFRLVLIGMVILPLLPNDAYGPYGVLNPFKIWLLVVLIVGISLGAYLAYLLLGARAGTVLGGILGGLISSTATTISYARRTRSGAEHVPAAAFVIMLASTVVFGRVLFEIAVTASSTLPALAPPLLIVMVVAMVVCVAMYVVLRKRFEAPVEQEPPSNLMAAIIFGLLYAAVLIGSAFAKEHLGDAGLYAVAALSGLTDMDAITLSTAQLVQEGKLDADTGWRAILIGAMANFIFKGLAVAALGHARLAAAIAGLFTLVLMASGIVLLVW